MKAFSKGDFTLPGEAGYEALTLALAEKWGADVIRDSDGTQLSDALLGAGYGVYSTICIIRDHNAWAKQHSDRLQQTFLGTKPQIATEGTLTVSIMADFFGEQFSVNASDDAMRYWQVYDRTTNALVPSDLWQYHADAQTVTIKAIPFHSYTVSFLAWRIWEEISMYNHVTNNWTKEHVMQIDPVYPDTQAYLLAWLINWCEKNPDTTVVRFTSMFYNFVWIWGSNERCRHLFSDWASYDFTVSPKMMDLFRETYGYDITAEDFINGGNLHVTHMPPTPTKRKYMALVNDVTISFGKQLIDIVHHFGKQAYMFYDDSWVGTEPYNERFHELGFDGMIKCVFSGYEARLCAGVDVPVHELRLHPYLFPVGLGGAPTFMEGGDPTLEAKKFWNSIRRALLREPVDRIGLGGYLHLTQDFPDFCDYIEEVAIEFRRIKAMHAHGTPYTLPCRVAVLHTWGKLRSWTLSGHFHETNMFDLIHMNEALSGLPVDVRFLSFDDVKNGALDDVDVVINAGSAGSAWSGGEAWQDVALLETITKWVYHGGTLIGVNEPSAVQSSSQTLRMADVLGVDIDTGAKVAHGRWSFEVQSTDCFAEGAQFAAKENVMLTGADTAVLFKTGNMPVVTERQFGEGRGIYLSHFAISHANTRTLLNLLLRACGKPMQQQYLTDNATCECAWFPQSRSLVVINNDGQPQKTTIQTDGGAQTISLLPYETKIVEL